MGTPADCIASVGQLRQAMTQLPNQWTWGGQPPTTILRPGATLANASTTVATALISALLTASGTLNNDGAYRTAYLECARQIAVSGVGAAPAYDITSGTQSTVASLMATVVAFWTSSFGATAGQDAILAAQKALYDLNASYALVVPGVAASSSAIDALLARVENMLIELGA